jgi:hypothetical protein
MARQRGESYCPEPSGPPPVAAPHCVRSYCDQLVVAEVHKDDYGLAQEIFRGVHRKLRSRRAGDERFFACEDHLEHDPTMAKLRWQRWLIFTDEAER